MNINYRIKTVLSTVIDVAYPNLSQQDKIKYKSFTIQIKQELKKTFVGKYSHRDKTIHIYDIYRPPKSTFITVLHELAHHIDYVTTGHSDHGQQFYDIFEKLSHAAMDMGIIKPSDIKAVEDTSDRNKMNKFIKSYKPNPQTYMIGKKDIFVYNSFNIKDSLKKNDYTFSNMDKCWMKTVEQDDLEQEIQFLEILDKDVDFLVRDTFDITIQSVGYIVVEGNTYEYKDELKEQGYYYNNKKWAKKIMADKAEKEIIKLKNTKMGHDKNIIVGFQFNSIK